MRQLGQRAIYTLERSVAVTELRTCSKCGATLPLTTEFFGKNQSTNTGGDKYFRPECKVCTTKARLGNQRAKRLVGNPPAPPMGTPCHNCGRTDRRLLFDHDHETLRHRGWLCDNCNRALGMLGDTIEALERMIRYLRFGNQHA